MIGILQIACIIAALILSFAWLVSTAGSGWSAPDWAGPAGLFALALAAVCGLFAARPAAR